MSITATVEKDTIKLPKNVHLPDGSKVRIELIGSRPSPAEVDARLDRATGKATSGLTTDEIMKMTRGGE
jgi:predicted DNA-binding antitoxin AbrB/MazE fold protein